MASLLPKNAVEVYQGASQTVNLVLYDKTKSPVEPLDLTGAVLYFTMKRTPLGDPLVQKRSTDMTQIAVILPRGGLASVYLKPADTRNLDPGDYVFDVWARYTATEDDYVVIKSSTLRILQGVTRLPSF